MKYTVLWLPSAERQLMELWNQGPDRSEISEAANRIDATLSRDSETQGESREEGRRILICLPLAIQSRWLPSIAKQPSWRFRRMEDYSLTQEGKMIRIVCLVLLAFTSGIFAESDTKPKSVDPALYIIENIPEDGVIKKRALVRISLSDAGKLERQTVVTTDASFFNHFGRHRLAENRYVVTANGGVIDLESKQILSPEQDGRVLGIEDGKVFYAMTNANRESGIFTFDFKTLVQQKLKNPELWVLQGEKSPNRLQSVVSDGEGTIHLLERNGDSKILAKGFRIDYSPFSSQIGANVPCFWLDGERILTQKANGILVTVDRQGKIEPVVEIPDTPLVVNFPTIHKDPANRIIYSCGAKQYFVDVAAKKADLVKRFILGNGFEIEEQGPLDYDVYKGDKKIGTYQILQSKAAPGVLACFLRNGKLVVWNDRWARWQTLEISIDSLIDWAQ